MELSIPPVVQVIITAAVMWLVARVVPFATVGTDWSMPGHFPGMLILNTGTY